MQGGRAICFECRKRSFAKLSVPRDVPAGKHGEAGWCGRLMEVPARCRECHPEPIGVYRTVNQLIHPFAAYGSVVCQIVLPTSLVSDSDSLRLKHGASVAGGTKPANRHLQSVNLFSAEADPSVRMALLEIGLAAEDDAATLVKGTQSCAGLCFPCLDTRNRGNGWTELTADEVALLKTSGAPSPLFIGPDQSMTDARRLVEDHGFSVRPASFSGPDSSFLDARRLIEDAGFELISDTPSPLVHSVANPRPPLQCMEDFLGLAPGAVCGRLGIVQPSPPQAPARVPLLDLACRPSSTDVTVPSLVDAPNLARRELQDITVPVRPLAFQLPLPVPAGTIFDVHVPLHVDHPCVRPAFSSVPFAYRTELNYEVLHNFLRAFGFHDYTYEVQSWCVENGARYLEEVMQNIDEVRMYVYSNQSHESASALWIEFGDADAVHPRVEKYDGTLPVQVAMVQQPSFVPPSAAAAEVVGPPDSSETPEFEVPTIGLTPSAPPMDLEEEWEPLATSIFEAPTTRDALRRVSDNCRPADFRVAWVPPADFPVAWVPSLSGSAPAEFRPHPAPGLEMMTAGERRAYWADKAQSRMSDAPAPGPAPGPAPNPGGPGLMRDGQPKTIFGPGCHGGNDQTKKRATLRAAARKRKADSPPASNSASSAGPAPGGVGPSPL